MKRRKNIEILFVTITALCMIFIELGINGTSIDAKENGFAIEVNKANFAPPINSSLFKIYRSPIRFYAVDELSVHRGINCISIENGSTPIEGRETMTRMRMIVRESEIFGNESDSFRLAKIHDRKCGGKEFFYTWNRTSNHHKCTHADFDAMRKTIKLDTQFRRHEVYKNVVLPSCLNINTNMSFYYGVNTAFMSSTANITLEAYFLHIWPDYYALTRIRFEEHDSAFDFGAEAALNFIEIRDGLTHQSVSQAINSVYDITIYRKDGSIYHIVSHLFSNMIDKYSSSATKSTQKRIEHLTIHRGFYSIEPESLVNGQNQVTTIKFLTFFLTLLLAAVAIFASFIICFLRKKTSAYDLSDRGTIANIVKKKLRISGSKK